MSSVEERKKIIARLGGRCQSPDCQWVNPDGSRGCTDPRCLQVDNKNGEGARGWDRYIKMLKDKSFTERYQLLCANCNWIKRIVNAEGKQRLNPPKETRHTEENGWEIKIGSLWVPYRPPKKEAMSAGKVLSIAMTVGKYLGPK
jgi:hypothetical protein